MAHAGSHGEPGTQPLPASQAERELLLATAIGLLKARGPLAVATFCLEHPEQAGWIQRQLDFLAELRLLDDNGRVDGVPRRLGDFEIQERIGGGGMGVVFRARQRSPERDVAVKVVRPELLPFEHARARFRREVDAVARVQHPAIVRIYAAGQDQGMPFLAMELLAGRTLAEVLEGLRDRPVRLRRGSDLHPRHTGTWPAACATLCAEVAEAMAHAHERGVQHRDLKPSNILQIAETGRPVVLDFGLAIGTHDPRITLSHSPVGSVPYASPERLRGTDSGFDVSGDVYSLGVTLYELLTGEIPFPGESLEALSGKILRGEFKPVRTTNSEVSRDLATVCTTAMAAKSRRYASMGAFAADLRRVLAKQPILAKPPGPVRKTLHWISRHPTAGALTLLALVLAIGTPTALLARERARASERAPLVATGTVESLLATEREMWPTSAALLSDPAGYRAWLREAEAVTTLRPDFEKMRDDIRSRGRHYPLGVPSAATRIARLSEELATLRASEAWMMSAMVYGAEARLVPLRERAGLIAAQLEDELKHEFADPADDRRHLVLVRLLQKLHTISELIPRVRQRLEHAELIERTEIGAAASFVSTGAAIADARANPIYRGLRLSVQPGLLPLGQDPRSGLFEFAHLPSGKPALRDPVSGSLQIDADTGVVLVLLPGGRLRMGASPADATNCDPQAQENESPCQDVEIAPFFMSKYELTQAQWQRVTGLNPSISPPGSGADVNPSATTWLHPVEDVTWYEARDALAKLGLRLPTEAHWEFAARGGTSSSRGGIASAELLHRHANHAQAAGAESDGWHLHAPIGTFLPNGFGLHDTLGNVAEWCFDGGERYAVVPAPGDGHRPCRPDCPRVVRGGGWSDSATTTRVSSRSQWPPGSALAHVGLRPALALR